MVHPTFSPTKLSLTLMRSSSLRATYRDVLDAPPHKIAEVVDGVLHLMPRPCGGHARVQTRLAQELRPFDRKSSGADGWIILLEPELHLGPDILVPDLAGWRRSTMPELSLEAAYFTARPDWACEVLSRSDAPHRRRKMELYAAAGVEWLWHIDPPRRSLRVLARAEQDWREVQQASDAERVRAEPFASHELDLAVLWER